MVQQPHPEAPYKRFVLLKQRGQGVPLDNLLQIMVHGLGKALWDVLEEGRGGEGRGGEGRGGESGPSKDLTYKYTGYIYTCNDFRILDVYYIIYVKCLLYLDLMPVTLQQCNSCWKLIPFSV